jgi:acyl carrier protein
MNDDLQAQICVVLDEHARLPVGASSLDPDADLFSAGMSSHASVSVMLALEDRFDFEFPDQMLTRNVFASIGAIATAVRELGAAPA